MDASQVAATTSCSFACCGATATPSQFQIRTSGGGTTSGFGAWYWLLQTRVAKLLGVRHLWAQGHAAKLLGSVRPVRARELSRVAQMDVIDSGYGRANSAAEAVLSRAVS